MTDEVSCKLEDGSSQDWLDVKDFGAGCSDESTRPGCKDNSENDKPTGGTVTIKAEEQEIHKLKTRSDTKTDGEEEVLDLDYDEGSPTRDQIEIEQDSSDDGELNDSNENGESQSGTRNKQEKEEGEEDSGKEEGEDESEKEEGELEDGELEDSDVELAEPTKKIPIKCRLSRPGASPERCPYVVKGTCTWGPDCKFYHGNVQNKASGFSRTSDSSSHIRAHKTETAWERGLREAREAMRRATKKREEPDFETKRLIAAPTAERVLNRRDSDSDDGFRRGSHSPSPPTRRQIPSLLDLPTSSPPRYLCRPTTRGITELGPQVRYPNGRPPPMRRNDRVGSHRMNRDRPRRETPPGPATSIDKRRSEEKPLMSKGIDFSPTRDASPISSDSSSSPVQLPRRNDERRSPNQQNNKVKKVLRGGGAMDDVSDPWARKKKPSPTKDRAKKPSRRSPSYSRSDTSGSDDGRTRKKRRERSPSSSSDSSRSTQRRKDNVRVSPPRGDITSFRIPKKKMNAGREDRNCNRSLSSVTNEKRSQEEEFFAKRAMGTPAAFRDDRHKRARKRSDSDNDDVKGLNIDNRDAENISDSESDSARSRSSSTSSSSRTRSPSPALPAKYRVVSCRMSSRKNPSPISDDDDDNRTTRSRSSSEGPSSKKKRKSVKLSPKVKKSKGSPPLREISLSPPPPPPLEPIRNTKEESLTPPPPPIPAEERKYDKKGPIKKKRKIESNTQLSEKERRKKELMEQLRAVEAELKKRTAASSVV